MKRLLRYMMSSVFVLGILSCEDVGNPVTDGPGNELPGAGPGMEDEADEVELSPVSLSVSLEADGLKTTWEAGDEIAVLDGTGQTRYMGVDESTISETSAVFSVGEGVSKEYSSLRVVYPSLLADTDGRMMVSIPVEQVVQTGHNSGNGVYAAVGQVVDNAVTLKNVCALIKVTISVEDITEVIIRGRNGEIIAGDALVDPVTAEVTSVSDGLAEIRLVTEDGSPFVTGDYYVAALPVVLEKGYEVVLSRSSDELRSFKDLQTEVVLQRNVRYDMADITSGFKYEWVNIIGNKAELDAFNLVMDYTDQIWVLTSDIDYEGGFWDGKEFHGTLDGAGHSIYNMKIAGEESKQGLNTGFITLTTGKITDLTFGSADGLAWDGVSTITHKNTHTGSNDYVGVIARLNNGAYVSGIRNFANISVSFETTRTVRVGGVAGLVTYNSNAEGDVPVFVDCVNYGNIENNAQGSEGSWSSVAGVVAVWESSRPLEGLANYGNVESSGINARFMGGVCALTYQDVRNCVNYGDVKDMASANNVLLTLGGIVGILDADNKKISGCSNHGNVSTVRTNTNRLGGIVGTVRLNDITGCANTGAVSVHVSGVSNVFSAAGGIAGFFDRKTGPQYISECTNSGKISVSGNLTANISAGGIMGICQNTQFSDNVNSGAVSATGKGGVFAGGICGWNYQTAFADMGTNSNSGDISAVQGTEDAKTCAGGIIGYLEIGSPIRGGINTGAVSAAGSAAHAGAIVGESAGSAISDCKVNGSVNGVELTAGNYSQYIVSANGNGRIEGCTF